VSNTDDTATVRVIDRTFRRQAECSCGWHGRVRVLLAAAQQDGWDHTVKTGHMSAVPYVTAPEVAVR
jgi:hypothetical protein